MRLHAMQSFGARLLGLYFLVIGLSAAPVAIAAVLAMGSAADETELQVSRYMALGSALQAVVLMAAGALLLIWRRAPSTVETPVEPARLLWVGLKLLGVFFLVTGASGFVLGMVRGSIHPTLMAFSGSFGGAMELAAGALLWIRASRLSGFAGDA